LVWRYVSLRGWADGPSDKLTRGLRDAYSHGCAIALPVGSNTLGWAMVEDA